VAIKWYTVISKPHQEKRAEMFLNNLRIETFLPLIWDRIVIRRTRRRVVSPLFPGYLFARFDVNEHFRAVTYARGVRKVLEFDSKPAEVDEGLIEAIKANMNEGHVIQLPERWKQGQVVRIVEGPLDGLTAVFIREMPGAQRALLLLQALGFRARVVMDIEQLEVPIAI
jgi:transcriptional antiterminator RfaH